tara:strand:- start:236 stop:874 length:639 start_codon:yes stop_codon:yes gene_type:complete
MANLIIKSSADDLVLKGSGGNSAITVGATGTLTFAENVTMSGTANNLGTVTAGTIAGGTITGATTFPAGHIRYLSESAYTDSTNLTADATLLSNLSTGTFTAGSHIFIEVHVGSIYITSDNSGYGWGILGGVSSSTGTASHSGLGAGNSGTRVFQEFGYNLESGTYPGSSTGLLVTPTNGATEATYNFYYDQITTGTVIFYHMKMILWEVYA